jgi:hypothetical protein
MLILYLISIISSIGYFLILKYFVIFVKSKISNEILNTSILIGTLIITSKIYNFLLEKIIDKFKLPEEKKYLYDLLPLIRLIILVFILISRVINFPIVILASGLLCILLYLLRCGKKDYKYTVVFMYMVIFIFQTLIKKNIIILSELAFSITWESIIFLYPIISITNFVFINTYKKLQKQNIV